MAYVRLNGTGEAFGWMMGERVTLGALTAGREYLLIGDQGEAALTADTQGAWQGTPGCGVPLVLTERDGGMALYNEERLTAAAAVLLAQEKTHKKAPEARAPEKTLPETESAPAAQTEKTPEVTAEEVEYRAVSENAPVDALPALEWPQAAEKLRPLFMKNRPIRLFDAPGWRFVQTLEAGMQCCFGYRAEEDRVAEVLYGVRARGGLSAPKGLQGYQYQRAVNGEGYWTLRQTV